MHNTKLGLFMDIEIVNAIKNIESKLGMLEGFFDSLFKEDDWSFVIKSHALLESVCAELLTIYFDEPELIKIFSRLALGEKNTGKLAFLRCIGLLDEKEKAFISELSVLRNELVHNVKNTTFTFCDYLAKLESNKKNNFIERMGYVYYEAQTGKVKGKYRDIVLSKPKETILESLRYVIAVMSIHMDIINSEKQAKKYETESLNLMKERLSDMSQIYP